MNSFCGYGCIYHFTCTCRYSIRLSWRDKVLVGRASAGPPRVALRTWGLISVVCWTTGGALSPRCQERPRAGPTLKFHSEENLRLWNVSSVWELLALPSRSELFLHLWDPLLTGYLLPKLPHVEFIGGLTAGPAKELKDRDLKEWVDAARDGFVLCSLGSRRRASRWSRSSFAASLNCSCSQWSLSLTERIFPPLWSPMSSGTWA